MDIRIIILCLFLYCEVGLCSKYPADGAINQFYTVTTDQKQTDKETFIYTENPHTLLNLSKFRVLTEKNRLSASFFMISIQLRDQWIYIQTYLKISYTFVTLMY